MTAAKEICFYPRDSDSDRKAKITEYLNRFEAIHNGISEDEWSDLVEPMNLSDYDLDDFLSKPKKATFGNWWELKEPNCWLLVKDKISDINKTEAIQSYSHLRSILDSSNLTIRADAPSELIQLSVIIDGFKLQSEAGTLDNKYVETILGQLPNIEQELIKNESNKISGFLGLGLGAQYGEFLRQLKIFIDFAFTTNANVGFCITEEDIEKEYFNAILGLAKPRLDDLGFSDVAAAKGGYWAAFFSGSFKDLERSKILDQLRKKLTDKIKSSFEAAFADQVIFQEQCFMLGNLSWFIEQRKLGTSLDLPYASGSASTGSAAPLNTAINIQGSPFAFVNKLAVSPDQKFLFDLKNEELSSITPSMRFFKVDSDPTDGKDLSTEITFDTNVANDLSKYMSRTSTKQGGRGLGVGVKSFNFSYEGTDPFSAKKAIKAKLVLYAPNFSDLLRERVGEKGRKYSYVDLALKTGKYRGKEADEAAKRAAEGKAFNIERENLDKLNFRLRAEVLWTANKDSLRLFDSQGKKDAIYNSAISFYLTPTIHEFDFDETGAVTFTINYLAYIEDYFAQPQFDIFGNLGADKKYRDLIFDYFRKAECDVKGFTDFKQIDAQYISSVNSNSLNKIVSKLRSEQLLYYVNISKDQMRDWLKNPIKSVLDGKQIDTNVSAPIDQSMVNAAVNKATASLKNASDEEKKKLNLGAYRLSLMANSDLRENIAFFYLSDLINVVMSLVEDGLEPKKKSNYYDAVVKSSFTGLDEIKNYVEENLENDKDPRLQATMEQFKKMRIVLGPMEVTPYTIEQQKQKMYSCTLGDLPISLNYFLDFMAERVLSNDFISYPFSKFIKDIINDCIKNFMNSDGCLMSDSSQRVSLNSTTVLAYNTSTGPMDDDLSNLIIEGNGGKWSTRGCLLLNKVPESKFPILKISGPNDQRTNLDISTMRNYYIFSIARRYPTDLYNGKADIDAKSGIFHYTLGADKGIVKNISLDKTNTPGLKELRFEQEGFDGLTQLREVYNANITTFLNPQTFPGTYIYVEPRGFDPTASEDLSKFGIGGYYMITKTAHSIQPGNAETTINAAWVADKGGTVVKNEGDDSETKTEDNNKILKCRVQAVQSDGRG